jgi:hypothetical protein
MGGIHFLLAVYLSVSILCGVALGLLRPLSRTPSGLRIVGGIVTAVGFTSCLVLMSMHDHMPLGPWEVTQIAIVTFGIGAVIAPLWTTDLAKWSRPDFDAWVVRLFGPPSDGQSNRAA